jgi:tetraacyldisaccharide 4'-kinase
MKQPQFWQRKSIFSTLLLPFAAVYSAICKLRNILTSPYIPSIPVICIGNVTIGGAGKTPTALVIAKILQDMGMKVCFLSRGYGGKLDGPIIVDRTIHTAMDTGDEPLLLSRNATTIIAKNRKKGAQMSCDIGADVIIMDDGLQNPSLWKSTSLLVIDGNYGIGNGRILPSGPLRETLKSALAKASAVIFIGEDKHNISPELRGVNIIKAKIMAVENNDQDKKYIAFAGIANPEKFFNTLNEYKYNVIEKFSFPDHYNYSKNDIEKLQKKAQEHNAQLITTEKDFVRLKDDQQEQICTLPIEIIWDDIDSIRDIFNSTFK